MYNDYNPQLDADYTYTAEYQPFAFTSVITNITVEGSAPVTVINGGGGGQATGPNVTFSGGVTGLNFSATGNTITLSGTVTVASGGTGATTAAGARTNLGAAEAGVNSDITMFDGLGGVGGWEAWTGASDKTAHATYSAIADALYNQAQVQALMDKVKELTEWVKAHTDVHLGSGIFEL